MNKVELLAPAGSYESFLAAINAGADAVYVGGTKFSARAFAKNFDTDTLCKAIDYAHLYDRKLYITINTLLKDDEISQLYEYVLPFYMAGIDGVIVQDMGALQYLKAYFPGLPLHISTQMTVTGAESARFLKEQGAVRIVPARELSLKELAYIREQVDIELETFIHGALCYCYSGQCLFSSILGGRSGNRGKCAQPCRLPYDVSDESGNVTNQQSNVINQHGNITNQQGKYALSLKDLATLSMLPKLIEAGISSFKIEGRMKKPEYVAGVTALYRKYIDLYYDSAENHEKPISYAVSKQDIETLKSLYIRSDLQNGYYEKYNGKDMITLSKPSYSTGDEALFSKIRERYINTPSYINITGYAKVAVGEPVIIRACYHDVCAEVIGSVVVQAQNRPVTKEDISKQILKTGNSDFAFEALEIETDGCSFLSLKVLNECRRDVLLKLKEKLLLAYRRQKPQVKNDLNNGINPYNTNNSDNINYLENKYSLENSNNIDNKNNLYYINNLANKNIFQHRVSTKISALAETKEQLEIIISLTFIQSIYVSIDIILRSGELFAVSLTNICKRCHDLNKECYLALPYIGRKHVMEQMQKHEDAILSTDIDGILIRNLEQYAWLTEIGFAKLIIPDANVYNFNRITKAFWLRHKNIPYATMPYELNFREMSRLGLNDMELIIYGNIPLMISANCVAKTTSGCQKRQEGHLFMLTDRYQKKFPIYINCLYCYNVIYNSVPLSLHKEMSILQKEQIGGFRLQFTVESGEETRSICNYFAGVLNGKDAKNDRPYQEFTKGHFKRLVE